MSVATFKGEGNGGLVRFRYRCRKQRSYLQRNVRRSFRYLMMGSAISSNRSPSRLRSGDAMVAASDEEDEEDEEDPRPKKRRRTSMFEAAASRNDIDVSSRRLFGHVTDEMNRGPQAIGKMQPVLPSDFYGNPRPVPMKIALSKRPDAQTRILTSSISDLIPPTTTVFQKALRFDINNVVRKHQHEDESIAFMRGRRSLDIMDIKCRCSIALFSAKNDENPGEPITQKDYQEVFRKPSFCVFRTTINDEGQAVRQLVDLEPFVFPEDELFTNRKKRNRRGQFVQSWGFAEDYYVSITLEPLGLQKQWPPFDPSSLINANNGSSNPVTDLLEAGKITNNDLSLLANMKNLFDPSRQSKSAPLKLSHGTLRQDIPYALRFEISWSLPSHLSELSTNIKIEADSPQLNIAAASTVADAVPASPLARKKKEISASDSPTDSREKRRRSNVATYNLKHLSALQQGKSPRIRRSRDTRSRSTQGLTENFDDVVATYTFGKADAAELLIKQTTTIAALRCPFCCHSHKSFDELRIHLHMTHTEFKFSLRRLDSQRTGFFVEMAMRGLRLSPTQIAQQARTFQLSQPRTLFNLDKFLHGDESWIKSREGPQHNHWPEHLREHFLESSSSSSPHGSRQSSPNTSNDTDDLMDVENHHTKLSIRPRKKYFVPKTNKPLYDTVTKQVLEPGAEIPNSDDEKDEGWLHQKHRDIILDYGDVTNDEKDYIIQWNPFIMAEQLTSDMHLGHAILRFVEANRSWFAQRQSRKQEFGKTIETFLMRGIIDMKLVDKCISILKEATKMEGSRDNQVLDAESPVSPAERRGVLDCGCGGHTRPPDRVICRGENCPGRFYHRKCAEKLGRSTKGRWVCDHCVS